MCCIFKNSVTFAFVNKKTNDMTTILTTKLAETLSIGCAFKWHSLAAEGNIDYWGTAQIVGFNPRPIFKTLKGDKIEFLNDGTRIDAQGGYWYSDSDHPVIIDALLTTSKRVNEHISQWMKEFRETEEQYSWDKIEVCQKNFCLWRNNSNMVVEVSTIGVFMTFDEEHKCDKMKIVIGDINKIYFKYTNLPYEVVDGTDKIKKDYDD